MPISLSQAITLFIGANLFQMMVHLVIMIRTGGEYKQRMWLELGSYLPLMTFVVACGYLGRKFRVMEKESVNV